MNINVILVYYIAVFIPKTKREKTMKTITLSGLILLVLMLVSTQAMAVGIGIFGELGKASNARVADDSLTSSDESHRIAGLGFVVDTAVAKDTLFNYRLNLGLEKWNWGVDSLQGIATSELLRVGLYNTFGFGIVRISPIRFWVGPQVGLTVLTEPSQGTGTILDIFQLSDNNGAFGYTVGAATGVNINIGEKFTVGADVGARRWDYYYFNANPTQQQKQHERTFEYYGNVSVMFRINDVF
jgi:hypothetical protein